MSELNDESRSQKVLAPAANFQLLTGMGERARARDVSCSWRSSAMAAAKEGERYQLIHQPVARAGAKSTENASA